MLSGVIRQVWGAESGHQLEYNRFMWNDACKYHREKYSNQSISYVGRNSNHS